MKKKKWKMFPDEKESRDEALSEEREEAQGEGESEGVKEDVALFQTLFPEVKADQIPSEVWEAVEAGERLSAAYALYSLKQQKEKEAVQKVNEENAKKAPPMLHHDDSEGEYFSPEAVKAMSAKEIKKHYRAIMDSMESWK